MSTIHLVIRDKRQTLFQGDVKSLTSYNAKGTFDILPEHTNFISIISDRIEFVKTDNTRMQLTLKRGVVHVKENHVEIYLGI